MKDKNIKGPRDSLLKRGKKGLNHIIFSRLGLVLALIIIQILFLFGLFRRFLHLMPYVWGLGVVFTALMVLYLINSRIDPTAKITWLVIIMLFPVFGVLLFCFIQSDLGHRLLKVRTHDLALETHTLVSQDAQTQEELAEEDQGAAALAGYVYRKGGFPIYRHTRTTYFPLGENKFEEMLRQLKHAEHFIFLEYFIVKEGTMWDQILDILIQKAKEGVEVRVMYDGTCEFSLLPSDYPKRLNALGIQCKVFARLTPFLSSYYNYRDHRKILVIDGHTAFTGGVNLADEYINKTVKYGHWKDTAIMLEGAAVKSFTLMFLQMWNIDEKDPEFEKFLSSPIRMPESSEGYVMPYGCIPLNGDKIGEQVYIDILNRAKKYVYIMTPYLILDGEMENALKFTAERGVEVKLILPGIPDKRYAWSLAKTHYNALLDAGVKIYEYTPGFVHAKVFVSDDHEAVVGTINLDYRSLYHHFECAAYLYDTDCIPAIKEDIRETLLKCRMVTYESIKTEKWTLKMMGYLLKALAPLM